MGAPTSRGAFVRVSSRLRRILLFGVSQLRRLEERFLTGIKGAGNHDSIARKIIAPLRELSFEPSPSVEDLKPHGLELIHSGLAGAVGPLWFSKIGKKSHRAIVFNFSCLRHRTTASTGGYHYSEIA